MNDPDLLEQTDTIAALIKDNIRLWNELLLLNSNEKVVEELKQIADQIEKAAVIEPKKEIVPEKKVELAKPPEEEPRKKGFFKRLFSKKELPPDTTAVEIIVAPPLVTPVLTTEEIPEPPKATITTEKKEEIKRSIGRIEEGDREARAKLAEHETRIALTGNRLREKIYELISKMESEVRLMSDAKSEEADRLALQTYKWLLSFMITGTILALSVIIIIISYVRKADIYNSAIIRSRDEAEELARTKELFMANMSHEIRTPVTAIAGFTEQLMHEGLGEKATKTLGIIKSSSDHLSRIINDILDFSKLQNNKLVLENVHFSIKKVTEEVYALFERDARQNGTSLSYSLSPDTPLILQGDPYRLKQIMINLVSNSIKFTINGRVHFSVDSIPKRDGETELLMKFTDTGIGIEESKMNMIFDDFTQAEMSTTRKFGGTGLGLSIVRKLVQLQNGTIEAISKKGQGTQITCKIPFLTGDEKLVKDDHVPLPEIPDAIRNMRVLVVDDEEYNRLLFKMILDRWGLEYDDAANGAEAVEKVRSGRYDIIFMDARMPVMDGLEASSIIRNELKVKIPVICISAASDSSGWEKYHDAGMNDFLLKPFREEELLRSFLSVTGKGITPEKKEITESLPLPEGTGSINLQNLKHLAGGNEDFVKQMLITFLETTEKGLDEMRLAFKAGESDQIAELAHKLTPPCRHIGASQICSILKQTEDTIRKGNNGEGIGKLIDDAISEFIIISKEIKTYIRNL
jgi:signal transduction histidine kinase/HPt (histidine-containing phosphotransfer) domain-containing protein/ActR/RegA family two-component response regulator